MSQADSEQWQQFDARIRADNQAAIRAVKAWQAAKTAENDILDGVTEEEA